MISAAKQLENEVQNDIKLADEKVKEGNNDSAKTFYEKAIALDKGNKNIYLSIKDKYLENGRMDDAYSIVMMAIHNDVDVENMKSILTEIKSKFQVVCLQDKVEKNNMYTLPESTTIKVNDVDAKAQIKWNSASKINTSKAGSYTFEGTSEQYGRTFEMVLTVKEPVISKFSGYVSDVHKKDGKMYLTVSLVDFYRDDEAEKEAEKDGIEKSPEGFRCLDGYYIREKKINKTYEISKDASLSILNVFMDPNKNCLDSTKVSFADFEKIINSNVAKYTIGRATLSWVTTKDDIVTEVYGQYTP